MILLTFPRVQFQTGTYHILFTNPSEANTLMTETFEDNIFQNDSLLFIDTIHGNATNASLWQKIKNHHEVSITIDLFYCGAVFFRKEQAKEHFKIRT